MLIILSNYCLCLFYNGSDVTNRSAYLSYVRRKFRNRFLVLTYCKETYVAKNLHGKQNECFRRFPFVFVTIMFSVWHGHCSWRKSDSATSNRQFKSPNLHLSSHINCPDDMGLQTSPCGLATRNRASCDIW